MMIRKTKWMLFGLALAVIALRAGVAAPLFPSTPAYAQPAPAPAGLTSADWQQITAQLPPLIQEAYLKASNTGAGDKFGYSVALSGNTVVVGAPEEDSNATSVNGDQTNNNAEKAGAAYVFVRAGAGWVQQAYLKASNAEENDEFGFAVAISGDTLVVGALLEDSNATGVDGEQTNNDAQNSGAAYVFVREGDTWSQQAYLKASNTDAGDFFGLSVAISDDTLVVGAYHEDSQATGVNGDDTNNSYGQAGAAYVFVREGDTWSQQAYLKASNTGIVDQFGYAVGISGDTVVVTANFEDSGAPGVNGDDTDDSLQDAGAAYVFVREGDTWSQQAYLKAAHPHSNAWFGQSVAISGDTIVVGSPREPSNAVGVNGNPDNDLAPDSGAAYVFVREGDTWSQQAYLKASNTGAGDLFGKSVAISGDMIVVGASEEDSAATGINGDGENNSALFAGAAYGFFREGNTWHEPVYVKASNTNLGDYFGVSVAVSGTLWVVGAMGEASSATGVNGDQTSNASLLAGAAYTYTFLPETLYLPSIVAP